MAVFFPEHLYDYPAEEYKDKPFPAATMWTVCSLTRRTLNFKKHNGQDLVKSAHYIIASGGEAEGITDAKYLLGIIKLSRQQRVSYFDKILEDHVEFSFKPVIFNRDKKTDKEAFMKYLSAEAHRCGVQIDKFKVKKISTKLARSRKFQSKILEFVDLGYDDEKLFYELGEKVKSYMPIIKCRRRKNKKAAKKSKKLEEKKVVDKNFNQ